MKSFYAQSVAWALGLAWLASPAQAQYPNQYSNSYLPIPTATQSYPVAPVALRETWQEGRAGQADVLPSPSDAPSILPALLMASPDRSVLSDDYQKAVKSSGWGGDDVTYDNGTCGPEGCTPCQNMWYGYAGALIMTRADGDHMLMTENVNTGERILCSCQGDMGWVGGFETTIGRTFNCGCNGLEFTYWGIYPGQRDFAATSTLNDLGTPIDFSTIDYDDGTTQGPASDWFNAANHHEICVKESIYNLELNLLGQCFGNGFIGGGPMAGCTGHGCHDGSCGHCGPRWGCGWMMGIRYFQFDNAMTFQADNVDDVWDGSLNEMCYHVNMKNRLIGFQVGGGFNWNVTNCFQLYALAKAGIYNNSIDQLQEFRGENGYGVFNAGDWAGDEFRISNSTNKLAMIGQIDLGARYQFNCHFSVKAGYRVLGVGGVALWEQQIPSDFSDAFYLNRIESNGSMVMHGAYIGGEFRF